MSHQDDCSPADLPKTTFMAIVMNAHNGEALTLTGVPGCPFARSRSAWPDMASTPPWLEEGDAMPRASG